MNQYTTYPQIWMPQEHLALFMIRVPAEVAQLGQQTYRLLLGQRIGWMIQTWMEQTSETQTQTHQRLSRTLTLLLSYQEAPPLMQRDTEEQIPLWEWIDEWVETFLERNETLMLKFSADFPITLTSIDLETTQRQLDQHDSVSLDDWLTELAQNLTTESIL